MSEHPELREAPGGDRFSSERLEATDLIDELFAGSALQWARVDNAHNDLLREVIKQLTNRLLAPAGPVGKLQARMDALIEANLRLIAQRDQLADPEHIRRVAIGARLIEIGRNPHWSAQGAITSALAAGESAVTGPEEQR